MMSIHQRNIDAVYCGPCWPGAWRYFSAVAAAVACDDLPAGWDDYMWNIPVRGYVVTADADDDTRTGLMELLDDEYPFA